MQKLIVSTRVPHSGFYRECGVLWIDISFFMSISCFVDDVEGGFAGAAEVGEASGEDYFAHAGFAGLCSQGQAYLLGAGGRGAEHG